MRIDILTLFPEAVDAFLGESMIGRGRRDGLLDIRCHNIRDYCTDRYRRTDDYPYGGGQGAVMQADPLYRCWEAICDLAGGPVHTIYMSPCGHTFKQADAIRLSKMENIVIVCGHYEGIDQRFIDECVDEEISLGDFVLTGGEIAAMAVTDAVCRMVPGVLADPECFEDESHFNGLLEYPQYSRPAVWHGREVPQILLSGNHAKVAQWRRKESLRRTRERRPDMYEKLDLSSKQDKKLLKEMQEEDRRGFVTQQFVNPANPEVQRSGTGEEIIRQVNGPIHGFCSGIGTGGTITGIGETLKKHNPEMTIWAVEPENAAILSGGSIGTHVQMGIGDGLIPEILNQNIYDDIYIGRFPCLITDQGTP